jgi:signal transduction histidine kinase
MSQRAPGDGGGEAGRERSREDVEGYYKALFSMVSHDIRAPLGVILGAVGEMPGESGLDPELVVLLRLIRRSGIRLSHYASNLLELSRMDAERFHLRPEPVCLRSLLEQAMEETRQVEAGGAVVLEAELPPAPIDAQVDPERLRLAVLNVLAKAYRQAHAKVTLRLDLAGEMAHLEVADDGRGFTADDLVGMFDQQRVVHESRGSGLELVLANRLVEAHGGTMRAENVVDAGEVRGSRLVMEIPLWHDPAK